MLNYTKGEWEAFRFSQFHNWKVRMGSRNEFLDLGQDDCAQANAQLIAAAPRLVEELIEVSKMFERVRAVRTLKGYEQKRFDSVLSILKTLN